MKYDEQYYFLEEDMSATSDVEWVDNAFDVDEFNAYKALTVPHILNMKIDEDDDRVPPVLGDFLSEPFHVWSKRARDIIVDLASYRVQMFPVVVHHQDQQFESFFFMNCHDEISAMHRKRSKFKELGMSFYIDSLSLDENILDKIPEDQRMIFALEEKAAYYLYHEKVVKALEGIGATGFRFVKVKDWNIGSAFD
jgi:hypothetical protein